MKRLTAWLAGLAGGAAAYRVWRRRPPATAPVDADPAAELRAKLAETRPEAEEPEPDVEARRRSVHEQGRSTLDEMRGE